MRVCDVGCDVLRNLVEAKHSSISVMVRCPSRCVADLWPPPLGGAERICERHVIALREQRLERCRVALRERVEGLVRLLDERFEIVRASHGNKRNERVDVETISPSRHTTQSTAPECCSGMRRPRSRSRGICVAAVADSADGSTLVPLLGTTKEGHVSTKFLVIVSVVLGATVVTGSSFAAVITVRASVSSANVQGDGSSNTAGQDANSGLSGNGRYIVFQSDAPNLVPNDTNGVSDIFIYDRVSRKTRRVSVSSAEAQANGASFTPAVSADGRFVVFQSDATNLVGGDTNAVRDIFIRDRSAGTTRRMSVSSAGAQADGESLSPSISADGEHVAFTSSATNLVTGDTNGTNDIFVRDRSSGKTRRVSITNGEAEAHGSSNLASLSADGRRVEFFSDATNLVPGDTNGNVDVFVRFRDTGKTRRVSVSSSEAQSNGSSDFAAISANGNFVAFVSTATNLVPGDSNAAADIFVRDISAGETRRVSISSGEAQANADSDVPAISADGRVVAFQSDATNLVGTDGNGTGDVFVRDRQSGKTRRVSIRSNGTEGNAASFQAELSGDGRFVAFTSAADNLVGGDTNTADDVFYRGPLH